MRSLLILAAAAASLMTSGLAAAQIQTVDPNDAIAAQPQTDVPPADPYQAPAEEPPAEWSADTYSSPQTTPEATPSLSEPTAPPARANEDVFQAAERVFGRGAQGLGGMLERILREQGEPIAYIEGQEAGGSFVFGVRYGSGTMTHKIEGQRQVFWTGPSLGFDFGANANKVFVLVYNLHDAQELFRRYAGAEGNAYAIGGFTAQYLRRGDVVLIPIRLGVGLRLGVNAGYMRFTENNRWVPF